MTSVSVFPAVMFISELFANMLGPLVSAYVLRKFSDCGDSMKVTLAKMPDGIPMVTWNQYRPLIGAVKEFFAVFSKQFPSLITVLLRIDKLFDDELK